MDLFKNALGTKLRWTVKDRLEILDVSLASTKQVKIVKPDLTQLTKTLVFSTDANDVGDGSDGRVEYVIESGVINLVGIYKWQLYLVLTPWTDHSEKGEFLVGDILF